MDEEGEGAFSPEDVKAIVTKVFHAARLRSRARWC